MLTNLLFFMIGIVFTYLLTYIMSIGRSVEMLKRSQQSCAALFIVSEQGLQEILQLKYIAMKEANRSEQNITAQKYIDQMNIQSIKETIMRNYVRSYPQKYEHTMEFASWEEMEIYVDQQVKKNKEAV